MDRAIVDAWNYAFFLLIACFLALSRMTMGIFTRILGSKGINNLSMKPMRYVKLPLDDVYKERVENLFVHPKDYNDFAKYVKSVAFSKTAKYIWVAMLVVVVLFAPTYWHWYTLAGIYDATGPLHILQFYVVTNLLFGAFFFPAYLSLLWLVIAVIRMTYTLHNTYGESLKITGLVELLEKEEVDISSDSIMGYSEFYSTLKPIGSYVSRATVLILLVAVISSVGSITGSFLLETDLGAGLNVIAIGVSATAIALFLLAQYILHLLLRSRKEHILGICCQRRDNLSIGALLQLKKKEKMRPKNRPLSKEEEMEAEQERAKQEKNALVLSITQDLIESVEAGRTWGFSGSELVEFVVTLSIEFVLIFI